MLSIGAATGPRIVSTDSDLIPGLALIEGSGPRIPPARQNHARRPKSRPPRTYVADGVLHADPRVYFLLISDLAESGVSHLADVISDAGTHVRTHTRDLDATPAGGFGVAVCNHRDKTSRVSESPARLRTRSRPWLSI